MFSAFQISVSFIWAPVWFTDREFGFLRRFCMLILSLSLVPVSSLIILFCTIWMADKLLSFWSFDCHLILPNSCTPYLILEVNRPSASFLSAFGLIAFFNLFSMNNLWFNDETVPPMPLIWEVHVSVSSIVRPSNVAELSCKIISLPTRIFNGPSSDL